MGLLSYSNNILKKQFDRYKHAIIATVICIYGLFIVLMFLNIKNTSLHDEIILVRFGLIGLTTIMFILTMRVINLKSREYYTAESNK